MARVAGAEAGLPDRVVRFVHALREAGVPVSSAETLDAVRAMGAIDLLDRRALKAAFEATMVKRPAHHRTFVTLFDLWFPALLGDGSGPRLGEPDPDAEASGEAGEGDGAAFDVDRDLMRDLLKDLLANGDADDLERFARQAVEALGRADTQPGRQSWFTYRVMRSLNPQTLIASLLDKLLGEQERGGFAEKVARQEIAERIRQFEQMVEAEVRRRLAEERGVEQISRTAVKPLSENVDFLRAGRDDLAELRAQVFPLARRLATRLTARRRLGDSGPLDFRRTVRASLATGGVPMVTHHRPHKPHKPELTVLCDVSGSVSSFAQFTLMLTYALREQFSKVRAFAFIDSVDEVTRFFTGASGTGSVDFADAMARMNNEAQLVWYDGHSDYGRAIEGFAERYPDAITSKTSLLVLGDGRNNYRATGAHTLQQVVARARHAYWLNPEPKAYWNSGDSAVRHYAELLEMVECRNALQLQEFVERLLPS